MRTLDMQWYEDTRYIAEYADVYYIAYVSIRQQTSANVSKRQHTLAHAYTALPACIVEYEDARFVYASIRWRMSIQRCQHI